VNANEEIACAVIDDCNEASQGCVSDTLAGLLLRKMPYELK